MKSACKHQTYAISIATVAGTDFLSMGDGAIAEAKLNACANGVFELQRGR